MYKIKAVTSMEKIFADREPSGEGFTGALTALRGGDRVLPDRVLAGRDAKAARCCLCVL
jgi:hypothetical protein